jgi:hypothetical protein
VKQTTALVWHHKQSNETVYTTDFTTAVNLCHLDSSHL